MRLRDFTGCVITRYNVIVPSLSSSSVSQPTSQAQRTASHEEPNARSCPCPGGHRLRLIHSPTPAPSRGKWHGGFFPLTPSPLSIFESEPSHTSHHSQHKPDVRSTSHLQWGFKLQTVLSLPSWMGCMVTACHPRLCAVPSL